MDDINFDNELGNEKQEQPNKFEENWGTLLNFLDNTDLEETSPSKIQNRNDINQSFLQEQKLEDEVRNTKKPKNMAEIYDSSKIIQNRSRAINSNRSFETPEINYVYRPLK